MKKVAEMSISGAIILSAVMAVVGVGYGLYQQSQLYPVVHQQIGYQKCVAEVQDAQKKFQEDQAAAKVAPEQNP